MFFLSPNCSNIYEKNIDSLYAISVLNIYKHKLQIFLNLPSSYTLNLYKEDNVRICLLYRLKNYSTDFVENSTNPLVSNLEMI